jgi:hypothetical protein
MLELAVGSTQIYNSLVISFLSTVRTAPSVKIFSCPRFTLIFHESLAEVPRFQTVKLILGLLPVIQVPAEIRVTVVVLVSCCYFNFDLKV